MAEESNQTLIDISLQLKAQLEFYAELGITDIGGALRDEQFLQMLKQIAPREIVSSTPVETHDEPTTEMVAAPEIARSPAKPESLASEPSKIDIAAVQKIAAPPPEVLPPVGLFADLVSDAGKPAKSSGLPILSTLPADKFLEDIRADIGDCTRCKLHEHRKHIVFGEGNPQARLMFIGEGPGADEDATGRPFVGRAGQLLDKIIAAIGKKREDVFIANVVKCRPPQNRAPEKDETDACEGFLFRQIKLINPKVIVALGSPAFQCLFRTKEAISRARGEFREWNGYQVMPTFHPAYLLRSPDKKREAWEDMKKVRDYLAEIGN
ncbi:MAG: uracil-DNA glycosylase [Acidobacteriota bacterium]